MEQRQTADILKFPKKRKPRKKQSKLKARLKSLIDTQEIITIIIGVVLAEITYDLIKMALHSI
jgi:hypothetical protein